MAKQKNVKRSKRRRTTPARPNNPPQPQPQPQPQPSSNNLLLAIIGLILLACLVVGIYGLMQWPQIIANLNKPAPTAVAAVATPTISPTPTNTPTLTPTTVLSSTPPPTATSLPTTASAQPAGPVSSYVSLKYDETNNDPLTAGQSRLVALYLRDAQAAGSTQSAMESAIAKIQQEAAATNATVFQGKTLKLDQHHAWLVWCSNATNTDPPADTSVVFDKMPKGPAQIWIQIIFAQGVPLRTKDTFSGCDSPSGFWAVAVH